MVKLHTYKGDTWPLILSFTDDNGPMNLTGKEILFKLKNTDKTTTIYTEDDDEVTIIDTDVENGNLTIKISSTGTSTLKGKYYFSLKFRETGEVTTMLTGELNVIED